LISCTTASVCLRHDTLGLADTLTLKDGRTVHGTYLGGTSRQVKMEIATTRIGP
jgi:hypothetical protein